jgi:hypothetical protein
MALVPGDERDVGCLGDFQPAVTERHGGLHDRDALRRECAVSVGPFIARGGIRQRVVMVRAAQRQGDETADVERARHPVLFTRLQRRQQPLPARERAGVYTRLVETQRDDVTAP